MRSAVLALAALACLHVAAAQQIGDEVLLTRDGTTNYQVYAEATGAARAPGNDNTGGFGFDRRAIVVSLPLSGRWQVRVNEDEPLIGGITGWVGVEHVELLTQAPPETGKARLTWFYDAGDEETGDLFSFMVERQERPGPPVNWMPIHETEPFAIPEGGTTYSWLDTGVEIGKTYAWRVRARRRYGPPDTWAVSNWSNEAQHTVTDEETVVPLAPANLTTEQLEP